MDNQPLHSRPTQKSSAESSRAREDQLNASTGAGRRSSIADRAGGAFIRPAKKLFERHSSKGNKRKDPVLGGAQAPQVNQPNPPHGRLQPSHGAQIRSADTTEDLYDGGRGMSHHASVSPPPSVASEPVTEIRMPPSRRQSQREYRPSNEYTASLGRNPETPPYTPHTSWGSQQRRSRPYTHAGHNSREEAGHPLRRQAQAATPVSPASISPEPSTDPEVTRWEYRERRREEAAAAARRANEERLEWERARSNDPRLPQLERELAQANARIRAYQCHEEEHHRAALEHEQQLEAARRHMEDRDYMAALELQIRDLRRQRRSAEVRYERMIERDRAERDRRREPRRLGGGRGLRVDEVRLDDGRIVRTETRRDHTRHRPRTAYYYGEHDEPRRPRREGITARQAINDARERTRRRLEGILIDDDENYYSSQDEEDPQERRGRRRHHRHQRRNYESY